MKSLVTWIPSEGDSVGVTWGRPGVPRSDSMYKPKRHTLEGRAVECRKQIEEKQDKTDYCLREKGKRPQRNEKGLELCQAMDSS